MQKAEDPNEPASLADLASLASRARADRDRDPLRAGPWPPGLPLPVVSVSRLPPSKKKQAKLGSRFVLQHDFGGGEPSVPKKSASMPLPGMPGLPNNPISTSMFVPQTGMFVPAASSTATAPSISSSSPNQEMKEDLSLKDTKSSEESEKAEEVQDDVTEIDTTATSPKFTASRLPPPQLLASLLPRPSKVILL